MQHKHMAAIRLVGRGRGPGRLHLNLRSLQSLMLLLSLAMPAVVIRQRKAWRRKDGVFLYFEVCALWTCSHSRGSTYSCFRTTPVL